MTKVTLLDDINDKISGMADQIRRLQNTVTSNVRARVYNSTPISTTTAVSKILTFDTWRFNDGGLHSTSVNPSRLTALVDGVYLIGCSVQFANNGTGLRIVRLKINGSTYAGRDERGAVSGDPTACSFTVPFLMAAGDYVEVEVFQNSTSTINVESSGAQSPEFWMIGA